MPIVKHGYRSDHDRRELKRFYDSTAWKQARAYVLGRAAGKCELCGLQPDHGRSLELSIWTVARWS